MDNLLNFLADPAFKNTLLVLLCILLPLAFQNPDVHSLFRMRIIRFLTIVLAFAVVALKYYGTNLPFLVLAQELIIGLLAGVAVVVAVLFVISWMMCCTFRELMNKLLG